METKVFTDWIKHLNQKLLAQNLKVAFTVDNCPAYPDVSGLTGIDLIFLPLNLSNTTDGSRFLTIVKS